MVTLDKKVLIKVSLWMWTLKSGSYHKKSLYRFHVYREKGRGRGQDPDFSVGKLFCRIL